MFLYFPEQFVLKNTKPTMAVHCREICWKIIHGGRYFIARDDGNCHCDFCPKDLVTLLLSPKRMSYFLEYTGCEDIFSLKKSLGVVHCWLLQVYFFLFCDVIFEIVFILLYQIKLYFDNDSLSRPIRLSNDW